MKNKTSLPDAQPHPSPTWRLTLWALNEIGLLDPCRKALGKPAASYLVEAARLAGHSHDDARKAWKALNRAIARGEVKANDARTWEDFSMRYQLARKAIRHAISKPSNEAKCLVATMLEKAAPRMPALAAKIDTSERALVGGSGPESKSTLVRSIEALQEDMLLRAKMLRSTDAISNPSSLLE